MPLMNYFSLSSAQADQSTKSLSGLLAWREKATRAGERHRERERWVLGAVQFGRLPNSTSITAHLRLSSGLSALYHSLSSVIQQHDRSTSPAWTQTRRQQDGVRQFRTILFIEHKCTMFKDCCAAIANTDHTLLSLHRSLLRRD